MHILVINGHISLTQLIRSGPASLALGSPVVCQSMGTEFDRVAGRDTLGLMMDSCLILCHKSTLHHYYVGSHVC